MKGWIGAAIACVTIVIALTVNPAVLFGGDAASIKAGFAAVLLCVPGLALVFGYQSPEHSLSRHVAIWTAGFAVIAIGATNMDILTGTSKLQKTVIKASEPVKPVKPVKKKRKKTVSTAIYIPDTPKFNRVENLVEPEASNFTDSDSKQTVTNLFSRKNSKLSENWKLTRDQKQQFEKFLALQGQKYNSDTAFIPPGITRTR